MIWSPRQDKRLTDLWADEGLTVVGIGNRLGVSQDAARRRAAWLNLPSRVPMNLARRKANRLAPPRPPRPPRPVDHCSETEPSAECDGAYVALLLKHGGFVWRELVGDQVIEHRVAA